jgi:hypothetical protein
MRRTFPLLLTLVLLVCAQSAGLVHGIGHGSAWHRAAGPDTALAHAPAGGAAAQGRQAPASDSTDSGCDKCFQFAHFSAGVAPPAPELPLAQTVDARAGGPQAARIARDAPATRSRGPPVYL